VSAAVSAPAEHHPSWRYDPAARRRSVRKGRERGCWVYIPRDELLAAGITPDEPPPLYRCRGYQRSRNGHAVMIDLYREP